MLITLFLLLAFAPQVTIKIKIDKVQAKLAYEYLNDIRMHASNYYEQFPFLKTTTITKTKLVWNDTIAKVAEEKAKDMAKRNYFEHINPDSIGINYLLHKNNYKLNKDFLEHTWDNNFESLAMNTSSGKNAIDILIWDSGVKSLGHRRHLLGIDEWNSTLKDIGIGYCIKNIDGDSTTYVCIVIAKHNW